MATTLGRGGRRRRGLRLRLGRGGRGRNGRYGRRPDEIEAALLALVVRLRVLLLLLLRLTGLLGMRNAALVGGAQDGKCRGNTETAREHRQLARSHPHLFTSMAVLAPHPASGVPLPGGTGYLGQPQRLLEQAHLAQDRDRVRVDVLALDLAVLVGDHVDPTPLDPL